MAKRKISLSTLRARPKLRTRAVPKPILALAAPPQEQPVVNIERLKDGTIVWSIRSPARSLDLAGDRALAKARELHAQTRKLEEHLRADDEARKDHALQAKLQRLRAAEKEKETPA